MRQEVLPFLEVLVVNIFIVSELRSVAVIWVLLDTTIVIKVYL